MKSINNHLSLKAIIVSFLLRITIKRWFKKIAMETSEKKLTEDIFKLRKFFAKMVSHEKKHNNKIEKIQINQYCSGLFIEYPNSEKTILYLHGGGYIIGSAETYSGFGCFLSNFFKINVFIINYRLVPENILTCAIEDAVTSYNYLLTSGIDPQKLFLMGDSAGGGLALSTTVKLRDMKVRLPKAVICFSPWTDLLLKNPSHQINKNKDVCLVIPKEFIFFKNIDLSHPYISPIYADFKNFPDIFIQVSDTEILLDDSIILADKAKMQGVNIIVEIWHKLPHCFQLFAESVPEAKQALSHVAGFINDY